MRGLGRTPAVFDELSERLWPDEERGPWLLILYWRRRKGRPIPVGHTLIAMDQDEADRLTLMTSTLRDLKIAEIASEERERLDYMPPPPVAPAEIVAGMRPKTLAKLRRVAEIYQEAWGRGENPTKEVARQLNTSAASAGNLVLRTREAGLLPPTSAGKPQG